LLEAGSVVGIRFEPQLVARALGVDAEHVDETAQRMARARLFLATPELGSDRAASRPYEFIHSLHRHLIYEMIPDRRRQRLHWIVGDALEAAAGERATALAAELSVHFERGGDPGRAVKHVLRCVALARQRFAPREALAFGAQAMALLERLPEERARHEQELELQVLLATPVSEVHGYTSSEVRTGYARARWLCEQMGDAKRLFEIAHIAWYRQLGGDEGDGARETVEELERIAAALPAAFRSRAKLARGRTELWVGRFGLAVPILRECVDELREQPAEVFAETYGVDPLLAAQAQCGLGHWFIGAPDRARAYAASGLARAEQLGRPLDLASAACQAAWIQLLCGSAAAGADLAARALAICADHPVAYFLPVSRFLLGAALVDQGDLAAGIPQMLDGLAGQRETTGQFLSDFTFASIAAAQGRAGRWKEALRYADEGLELAAHTLERLYVAELWRIKGELLAARVGSKGKRGSAAGRQADAARECVRQALEIARRQESRSLELRAAMSLARLAADHRERAEAREVLRKVLETFAEGFDTRDLREAAALLGRSAGA